MNQPFSNVLTTPFGSDTSVPSRLGAHAVSLRLQLNDFLLAVQSRALRMAELGTRNPADALDVVQEAMCAFARSYSAKPFGEWKPLFFAVLDSKLTDFYRRRSVRTKFFGLLRGRASDLDDDVPEQAIDAPVSEHLLPDASAFNAQTSVAITKALQQLPGRQRQAFLLRIWEGLDTADTARAMRCSEGSVKTHLFRACAALRTQLEAHL